jgi:hypothetical protein
MARCVAVAVVGAFVLAALVAATAAGRGASPPDREARQKPVVLRDMRDAVRAVPPAVRGSLEDWYIVRLRPDVPDPGVFADDLAARHGLIVTHVYRFPCTGSPRRFPRARWPRCARTRSSRRPT